MRFTFTLLVFSNRGVSPPLKLVRFVLVPMTHTLWLYLYVSRGVPSPSEPTPVHLWCIQCVLLRTLTFNTFLQYHYGAS